MLSELLAKRFLTLKQQTNSMTHNPLLNCFDQDDLQMLDTLADQDRFVAEKKKEILGFVKGLMIDFDIKLKSAYDEYTEALTYLRLKNKFPRIERIREGATKTPDFKIPFTHMTNGEETEYEIYVELKSMAFADGNLNYLKVMEDGFAAKIHMEVEIRKGKKIAMGITEIAPFAKSNSTSDSRSTRYATEILIDKIAQNIKEGQFSSGPTVLFLDLKQLVFQGDYRQNSVPIFQETFQRSVVSGVLWNAAFGKAGHLIFQPIEFEGSNNTDGELEKDGILSAHSWVEAIVIFQYSLNERHPKIVGFYKQKALKESVEAFLHTFCDFVNDDANSYGYELHLIEEDGGK